MTTVDFEARVETTMDSIQSNDDIHPDNKERIRELKLADMSDAWLQKLTAQLKIIAEHVGDNRFEDMDEDDVKESYAEADPDDTDTIEAVGLIDELTDDPETKEALLDEVADKVADRIAADDA